MGNLQGKVALVTGAARKRGIGRAIAVRLAADGADVVVSGSPRDPASYPEHERAEGWKGIDSVVEEIHALGRRAIAVDCDVSVRAQVENLVARATGELGRINVLVNNAADPGDRLPIVEMDDEVWYRVIDVNLNGLYLVTKAVARQMIEAGQGGRIINISSTAGRVGIAGYGAYCATKFATIGFTQQLAVELASHQILVNCVCPGSTDTDMMDETFRRTAVRLGLPPDAPKAGTIQRIPLGRQGRPEDQAAVVAFLASEDSAYMTGQSVNVDGGIRMD